MSKPAPCIDFVLVSDIEGMHFHQTPPNGFEFTPESNHDLQFALYFAEPDSPGFDINKKLKCKTYTAVPASKEQVSFVDSYINMRMLRVAEGVSLPFKFEEELLIDCDGSFTKSCSPRRYLCPQDIRKLIEDVELDLATNTDRFLKLLRWRQGIDATDDVLRHAALYWRIKDGDYLLVPLDGGPNTNQTASPGRLGIHWEHEEQVDLMDLWVDEKLTEPLAHALLREATVLASKSPRSSIMIMVAALETGVKTHISHLAQDTTWLMGEPTPPIYKLLKSCIPEIHSNHGNKIDYWDEIKPNANKAQKLIKVRNTLAHNGEFLLNADSVENYLELVSDILYVLDVLNGHEWAKSLVSYQLRNKLGWPDPKYNRGGFIFNVAY
jgi:hypothetical protein